ncbi:thioredoxin family protein [Methanospirillum lacunae]|uniref:Thioredoxin n=1 Tax=Methanospirillum lacunae TaxID=668570 RepID=A0A2V2MY32_9EURY|nr:thioredoxin family protein [Methanospirillum lacunae]PWR73044.1 thioredoxin family protein [Methanospirillum lacunae]
MKFEILGSGCTKCKRLYDNVVEAVKKAGIQADVIKIEDMGEIVSRGILMPPSLFMDGEEVFSGRVPSVNEIIEVVKGA